MRKMQKTTIARYCLWLAWFLFTAFYIYPKYLANGIYDMTGTFMDWISQHHEGLILAMWAAMTVVLFIEVLIKITKEEDSKREAQKPTREETKEDSESK